MPPLGPHHASVLVARSTVGSASTPFDRVGKEGKKAAFRLLFFPKFGIELQKIIEKNIQEREQRKRKLDGRDLCTMGQTRKDFQLGPKHSFCKRFDLLRLDRRYHFQALVYVPLFI